MHHVYIYPGGDSPEESEGAPEFTDIPPRDDLPHSDVDGTIDHPEAWRAVADLFDVPHEATALAAHRTTTAYRRLGEIFGPFEAWWDALRIPYPGPPTFGAPEFELDRSGYDWPIS